MKTIYAMIMAMVVSGAAFATSYTWQQSSGTHVFQTAENWNPTIVGGPAVGDTAQFNLPGSYGVAFSANAETAEITLGANTDVAFDLGGYAWSLGSISLASPSTARFGGGELLFQSSVQLSSNCKLVLDSGTSDFMGAPALKAAGGMIEINGGNHTLANELVLNAANGGGDSFRMTGGTLSLTNKIGLSRLNINNGAKVSLEGGTLSVKFIVDVFNAEVNIQSNATLKNIGASLNLGRQKHKQGVVNVLGGTLEAVAMNLGLPGSNMQPNLTTGILNLVEGSVTTPTLKFGAQPNSVGELNQSGGDLRVSANFLLGGINNTLGIYRFDGGNASCVNMQVGQVPLGTGVVYQTGGTLTARADCQVGCATQTVGRIWQSGGDFIVSNKLVLGSGPGTCGSYTNTGGNVLAFDTVRVGYGAGAYGRFYFNGSSFDAKGGLNAGNLAGSTGAVELAGGVFTATNSSLYVGDVVGSTGFLTISGGTNLIRLFRIGSRGDAFARITGGYTYSGTNTFSSEEYGRIVVGEYATSTARLELVGGVLATSQLDGRVPVGDKPGGHSEILFDGGTLVDTGESPSANRLFLHNFTKAELSERGAVIVSDGVITRVLQILVNAEGQAGSFTKQGPGPLLLMSPANDFTGRVTVEEGELVLAPNAEIYLTGGAVVEADALMDLASGVVRDTLTASGTVSRIDGALALASGLVLTNGVGAAMGGSGVITGSVVFASGSALARDKTDLAGALLVTGSAMFEPGAKVSLTGYTEEDLEAGIVLMQAGGSTPIDLPYKLPVTLDGESDAKWWAKLTNNNRTLVARLVNPGTLIRLR